MFPGRLPFPTPGEDRAHGVELVECTIPADMTIAQWRRTRSPAARGRHPSRALRALLRLPPSREVRCDHLQGTTTRYDHATERLEFLMVCSICKTERLVESMPYEPRFEPNGATVPPAPQARRSRAPRGLEPSRGARRRRRAMSIEPGVDHQPPLSAALTALLGTRASEK